MATDEMDGVTRASPSQVPPPSSCSRVATPSSTASAPPQLPSPSSADVHLRRFSFWSLIGLAYAVLNSPTAASASLSLVLPSGGGLGVFVGMIVSAVGVWCIAASMAELCACMPLTGGPYHWTYLLSPPKSRRALAYFCGWISCAGWVALSATTSSLLSTLLPGIISLMRPETYEQRPWHSFLIFIGLALFAWLVNCFGAGALDAVHRAALVWSVGGVVVIGVTVLATASPRYQDADFVFQSLYNQTGWPDGMAFLLGLLQATFALVGSDAAAHIVLEVPQPARNASLAMLLAPLLGATSALTILVVYLFVLTDYRAVVDSASGPLLEILYQATGDRGGAVALYMFPCLSMVFASVAVLCASSRQVQAFAHDGGLPFSALWARELRSTGTPVAAISLVTFFVFIFGLIVLGSETAVNSILSSSVVLLQVSYSVPVLLVLVRGRKLLDDVWSRLDRPPPFRLDGGGGGGRGGRGGVARRALAYAVGVTGVTFALATSVLFCFPTSLPTSGPTANYVAAVLGVVACLAAASWFVAGGRRGYEGPRDVARQLDVTLAASGLRTDVGGARRDDDGDGGGGGGRCAVRGDGTDGSRWGSGASEAEKGTTTDEEKRYASADDGKRQGVVKVLTREEGADVEARGGAGGGQA